jgi:hypothetical protein
MSRNAGIRTHAETQAVKLPGRPMRFLVTAPKHLARTWILQQA